MDAIALTEHLLKNIRQQREDDYATMSVEWCGREVWKTTAS